MKSKDSIRSFAQAALDEAKKEREKKAARKALFREMTSSKEKAISFLKEAGICDDKGELSKIYQ